MQQPEPKTERIRRCLRSSQHINAAPEAIFPLLCPLREYDWIPGWDCRLVYTESGLAEPGCVFQTDRPAEGGLDTWVVSRHEPNRHVSFVRINDLRTMQYDIRLEPVEDESSILVWEQVITSLSDKGDRHVAALREDDFVEVIARLEVLLSKHLARQTTLEAGS